MNKDSMITLKKQLDITDLAGEKVMIDFESGKYFLIKGVGNDIWDLISDGITVGEIIDKLLEEYDVSPEVCEKEVISFLTKMKDYDFI